MSGRVISIRDYLIRRAEEEQTVEAGYRSDIYERWHNTVVLSKQLKAELEKKP